MKESKDKQLTSGKQGNWWEHGWGGDREALQCKTKVQKTSEKVVTVTEREDPRSLPERFIDEHLNRMDNFYQADSKLLASFSCITS